ncbi:hypothetical protein [Emticicia sp. 21SJ11W-3]|uniref:hypothetical protein n=1 Tax=Emticicia sp. 21SJ11W-3 TaxID=2916755 RepID=UPI00209F3C22|nr:hypothetical protein [Emticicia sp. 21SJ11W-3]UTA66482.1 hypothetical protein MB380_12820 [Emticicia sp. 21SJ11W-3]
MKNTEEVLSELKDLIQTDGYIYSLCLILFEDFHFNLDKIHEVNHKSKLSNKECTLILGFLVQDEINFTIPESFEVLLNHKEKTYTLMKELQDSLNFTKMNKLREIFTKFESGEEIESYKNDKIDFFIKDRGMIEPTFYSGDGVYDFQYLENLERKYKFDLDWLLENRNFEVNIVRNIVNQIKKILFEKSKRVALIDLKGIFPKVTKKARKKLKSQYTEEQINKYEKEIYNQAMFYQYRNLFSPISSDVNKEKLSTNSLEAFCGNLVDLFVIRESDFENKDSIQSFFHNFSFEPNCNAEFKGPGYFNILNSRPLVKLSEGRYFAPINYLISEAVYESPFYWMWDDLSYRNNVSKHRGDVGEEIAWEFLSKIFGIEYTFKSVLIRNKKGHPITDIDVLCLLGTKALCVQVKSKKLTYLAKRGEFEQLTKDFKGAIQDAYNQGLISRKSIMDDNAIL